VHYNLDGTTSYTDGNTQGVSVDLSVGQDTEYDTKILEIIKRK